jgi:hypothetical protein
MEISGGCQSKSVKKNDAVGLLCAAHSEMMRDFSRRCVGRLHGHGIFGMLLARLGRFLEANVGKEIEKDVMIIWHAAECFGSGRDADTEEIFGKTKDVDRAFMEKLPSPLRIDVRYDDFEVVRKQRIGILVKFVSELLKNGEDSLSLGELLKKTFTESRFRETIAGMFHLYNLETRTVGNSIALPPFAASVRERFVGTLFAEMEQVAGEIADEYANKIYRGSVS